MSLTTLPGRDYHAADVFALERATIFAREWCLIGHLIGREERSPTQARS